MNITIKTLVQENIVTLTNSLAQQGIEKKQALFEQYLEEQNRKERLIWLACDGNNFVGYVTLKWISGYRSFQQQGIPEIKDLNVVPNYRKKGIGSQLLTAAEQAAFLRSSVVGIGVGLYEGYGPAQKLYVKRGYIPDGRGLTYDDKPLSYGQTIKIDDDLILWFTKAK